MPSWTYPLMALDNFVLTVIVLRFWFPKQDIERIKERRAELRQRARRWLIEGTSELGPP